MPRGGLNAEGHNISGLRVREDGVADERVCVEETADERQQSSDEQSLVPCSDPCHLHGIQGIVARLNRRATRRACPRSPTHEPTRQPTASPADPRSRYRPLSVHRSRRTRGTRTVVVSVVCAKVGVWLLSSR